MASDRTNLDVLGKFTVDCLAGIVPMVAEHLHVLTAVEMMKSSVADYMTRVMGLPKEVAAAHMGVSVRWVYKHLQRGHVVAKVQHPVRREVLDFFWKRYPKEHTIPDCMRAIEQRGTYIDLHDLVNVVEAYCSLGYLERTEPHRYRWRQSLLTLNLLELEGRVDRVSGLVPLVIALLMRYLEGRDAALRQFHVRVTRDAYAQMVSEIKAAIQVAVEKAIQDSYRQHPEGFHADDIEVEGLFIIGPYTGDTQLKE